MNKIITAAAASAFALIATPALAQDMAEDQPFSGVYVGVTGGYDIQNNDTTSSILFDRNNDGTFGDTITTAAGANAFGGPVGGFCNGETRAANGPTNPTNPNGCNMDKDSWSYYVRAGADRQYGNLVVGLVAEFGKSEIDDSVTAFSTTPASYVMFRSIDWEGSVRLRAGVAAKNTLFYGTGGGSYAKIDRTFFSTNVGNAYALSGKQRQFGFVGGGGIEQKIGRNISIGMEYLYHQYKDDDFRVQVTQGTQPATNPFILGGAAGTTFRRSDDKFSWNSIRGTVAFRF